MADTKLSALTASSALTGTELFYSDNGTADVKVTASQLWTLAAGSPLAWSTDLFLYRDAANTFVQRNGINAQNLRLYGTFTDSANYERLSVNLFDISFSSGVTIITNSAGTGLSRTLSIGTIGASSLLFVTNNAWRWLINSSGHFTAYDDNLYDIGASGTSRPRYIYAASAIVTPSKTVALLPAAATAGAGARSFVTDATTTVFGTTVVGGGVNKMPVCSDGTNWLIG